DLTPDVVRDALLRACADPAALRAMSERALAMMGDGPLGTARVVDALAGARSTRRASSCGASPKAICRCCWRGATRNGCAFACSRARRSPPSSIAPGGRAASPTPPTRSTSCATTRVRSGRSRSRRRPRAAPSAGTSSAPTMRRAAAGRCSCSAGSRARSASCACAGCAATSTTTTSRRCGWCGGSRSPNAPGAAPTLDASCSRPTGSSPPSRASARCCSRSLRMRFAERAVGEGARPLIVAELSGNHNGSLERALAIVDAAADAGADAVKLQTYTADTMTLDAGGRDFTIDDPSSPWHGRRLYDLYGEAATPWEWHPALFERARERGIACFSSPFDESAIAYLERFDPPAYKIASFELTDLPLIAAAARTGRPLVVSTGMATLDEIGAAVTTAREHGAPDVVLLKCT